MNNPESSDPLKVLCPTDKPGSAGNRLWNLSGMSEMEYLLSFERRNLLSCQEWDADKARFHAQLLLRETSPTRRVVVLGRETWRAFGFPRVEACSGHRPSQDRASFYFVQHPSGRNLFYNDKKNCAKVRRLLRSLVA